MKSKMSLYLSLVVFTVVFAAGCSTRRGPALPDLDSVEMTATYIATQAMGTAINTPVVATATNTQVIISTPTFTATVGTGGAEQISVVISNQIIPGIQQVGYMVAVCDALGVTITNAAVSVNGPAGVKALPYNSAGGIYAYITTDPNDFQYGQNYTITVSANAHIYTHSLTLPANVVIAPDGSTVTWATGGAGEIAPLITVMDPAYSQYTYGPAISSPFDLVGTGVFTAGAGMYNVTSHITRIETQSFAGSNTTSACAIVQQTMAMVVRF